MRAYVGVDWSASEVVCSVAVEGKPPRKIPGARPKLSEVLGLVRRIRQRHQGVSEIHVIIEAGAEGWARLFHAAKVVVHVVDPRKARRFAESIGSSGAKDDQRDADVLAMLGQSPNHLPPVWAPESDVREQLGDLADAHEQLTTDSGRDQQRLRSMLREHMPLVDAALPNVSAQWAVRFLRKAPTPWHGRQLDRPTLDEIVGSRVQPGRREEVWAALQQTEAPWLTEARAEALALRVNQMLDRLELLDRQLAEVDARLDELLAVEKAAAVVQSIPGIGLQQAIAVILFGLAGGTKGRDDASIRMGASPVFSGSAKTPSGRPKGHARMRKSASARAKRASYLLGRLAMQHLGWAGAMYADARKRGQNAATAFRRIARSVLRIVTALARDSVPYDDERYVRSLKAKGVPWAAAL